MTIEQQKFLHLAVVKCIPYSEIEQELGISRKIFSPWWNELKQERLELTKIRVIWKSKCPELSYEDFSHWYQNADKKCFYCDLTEAEMQILWEKVPALTKRTRGRVLEIDRVSPNKDYYDFTNLVFACYWCNNAKTDTFTGEEFKKVGRVFAEIWRERLK
ncbi:hypothetical protein [Algoriphagus aquimarinus]|uniref:hypothetical protein n=1 Tax=Algoriphagus aquimarinus TaxID=237018 RepID=UPI0030DC8DDE|tara:strand:- start:8754 stop:9233 length:480 start_codon:yes stop_codon:yes gene_type:complete